METSRPIRLSVLTPHTLGESHSTESTLHASLTPSGDRWRVEWLDAAGLPVSAEGSLDGHNWSQPEPGLAAPVGVTSTDTPTGMLTCVALPSGRAGLRSGRRLVGTPPQFPSASLVLCQEDEGSWRDVAFADEPPEQKIGSVSLAVAPTDWLAAYLLVDKTGRSVCRVVHHSLTPPPVASSNWRQLPPYPQAPGMAGMMVGLHNGVLIAAGGANFPDSPPYEGGKKKIYDEIYVLLPGEKAWTAAGRLPSSRGYGATVSLPSGVLIAGGEDATQVFQDTLILRWTGEKVEVTSGPALPAPATCAVASLLNNSVYLTGGYTAGTPRVSQQYFWQLDLSAVTSQWKVLSPWPGPTRALAVIAAVDGAIYLMSGIEVGAVEGKETPGVYLNDAYRFRPGASWEKLPDLPWSALAAPSPAPVTECPPRIFVLGGVDGRQAGKLPLTTGLPDDIIYFDVKRNAWQHWPVRWPTAVVCVSGLKVGEEWIIVSGELRPGFRTSEVWAWKID